MSNPLNPDSDQSGLLPALHQLQEQHGYIPEDAIPELARTHHISRAEVLGVIGFYHDFRLAPPGRIHVRICRAESCLAMGADRLAGHATRRLGVEWGETSAGGASCTLETVYCLGNCACSPAVMINGKLYGRVSAERLDALLAQEAPT